MSEVVRAPKTTGHLRQLEQLVRGELPAPPIAKLVGFTILQIELGRGLRDAGGPPAR
jgi:hypothetical protein